MDNVLKSSSLSLYSQCKPNCVDGVRTRSAWCEVDGVVVADTMCCNNEGIDDVKPHTSELCTNVPGLDGCFLTPLWKTGEFSAVSTHTHTHTHTHTQQQQQQQRHLFPRALALI